MLEANKKSSVDELGHQLLKLSYRLYKFSSALIPDELQAKQLVYDCLDDYLQSNYPVSLETVDELEMLALQLFHKVYFLGRKRYFQVRKGVSTNDEATGRYKNFYKLLNFQERAVLYLSLRENLDVKKISFCLGALTGQTKKIQRSASSILEKMVG